MKWDSASASALSSTLRSPETERSEEPGPLRYWSPLVATKTSFLSGQEVTPEGRRDGGPRSASSSLLPEELNQREFRGAQCIRLRFPSSNPRRTSQEFK
ncbi:hypothetical protein EYF80_036588 [Liparis tanakae]|uniref:Uncharacterized protein n=1 Tax=Liparis tanakae TaxID=230148 RepID=A0A4Z2GID0_9TELE|nr:hypothetical protein EYF80_036588 [Liparis tanakae]